MEHKGADKNTEGGDRGGRDEMVRFFLGVTWMDRLRNEYICGTAQVRDKVEELGLRWFGYAQRRDSGYDGKRIM